MYIDTRLQASTRDGIRDDMMRVTFRVVVR